ncbi:hypothetical protein EVAR_58072_1 [Eumeta japonica]|uniref:Uncharacterized protein n=1 Tax=Eumeta variegata TaxID=151549 RepID=A0A4C1ZFZ3_EUMVA|nr:hypothetical protein EVAR_58072_1 [Eumeta japonica]
MPESYDTAMRQPAPNQSTSERLWYLPHFAVTHPQKKKVRLVFDAAARTNGKCLNDALLTGPDLIRSLLGVLVRFRQGRVACRPTSRKCSCGVPNDVTDFRRRLIALYCDLHQNRNASEFELEYPEACKAIRLDHYVDDFLKSFNSIEEARRVSKQVYEIHRKAAFELRGWASNEIEVLNEMPDTRNDDNVQLGGDTRIGKTLGLQWDINNDALGFNLGLRNTPTEVLETSLPPTKRQVTSAVMSVFDPLGLASPVLITGKCMLQDIWRSGIDWDETIEADAHKKWLKWVNDIKKLASIRIPRCISPGHTEGATCVRRRERKVVRCGRVLAYKIERTRKRSFANSRKSSRRSLEILSWIRSDPRSFKPLSLIAWPNWRNTTVKCWRWVPTKLNVADDATRDPPTHFDETHRWFHGPDFLRKAKTNGRRKLLKRNADGEERSCTTLTLVNKEDSQVVPNVSRFSSWTRLLRSTARVLQAIDLFRVKRKVNALKHKRTATKTSSDPTWKHISKKAHTPAQKDNRRLEENDRHL